MSRHQLDAPGQRWTVGFDPPLATFYAQVEPHPDTDPCVMEQFRARWPHAGLDDPDDLLLTVAGDTPRQVPTVAALARLLAEHDVPLPADLAARLLAEQPGPSPGSAVPPSAVQAPMQVEEVVAEARAALEAALRSYPHPPTPPAAAPPERPEPGPTRPALPGPRQEWGRGR